jgi:hypothetical protein
VTIAQSLEFIVHSPSGPVGRLRIEKIPERSEDETLGLWRDYIKLEK